MFGMALRQLQISATLHNEQIVPTNVKKVVSETAVLSVGLETVGHGTCISAVGIIREWVYRISL